jgi:hypothetical protein
MRDIPWQAKHQHGVFTTEQAADAGWSECRLTRAVQRGFLVRLRRGAYAEPELEGWTGSLDLLRVGQRGVAAALRVPASTISHSAAVALHGLPLLALPEAPCITLRPGLRTRPWNLHVHRQPIRPEHLDQTSELRLTSVVRSCIDHAREHGTAAGLVAADAALHNGLCTEADLTAMYDDLCRGGAGLAEGRTLLSLLDGKAESPLESISRLALRDLPTPRTQVGIHSIDGRFIARVDFYWESTGVVGEADGRIKYTDDALWQEKRREEQLSQAGLVVVRWGWSDALATARLSARIQQGFQRAERMRTAGIPINAIVRP